MYGLLITAGIILGAFLAEKEAKKRNLDPDILWEGLLISLILAIIGARLYHVIDFWWLYKQDPLLIFFVWKGGLGIFGGLLGAFLGLFVYSQYKKQDLVSWLDVGTLFLPLGQAIGRWGNYFNNELLSYAIYESLADLLLFFVLFLLNRKKYVRGRNVLFYLLGYATIRLLLESTREEIWTIYGISVARGVSLIIILAILITYVIHRFGSRRLQTQNRNN